MRMKTYTNRDGEEMTCSCNFHLAPVIVDVDNLIVFCSICGHAESFPEYALQAKEDEIKEHYAHPLKDLVAAEKEYRQERENKELQVIRSFA